jgi:hypothetical protein
VRAAAAYSGKMSFPTSQINFSKSSDGSCVSRLLINSVRRSALRGGLGWGAERFVASAIAL